MTKTFERPNYDILVIATGASIKNPFVFPADHILPEILSQIDKNHLNELVSVETGRSRCRCFLLGAGDYELTVIEESGKLAVTQSSGNTAPSERTGRQVSLRGISEPPHLAARGKDEHRGRRYCCWDLRSTAHLPKSRGKNCIISVTQNSQEDSITPFTMAID